MARKDRKLIALDTLQLLKKGFYKTANGQRIDIQAAQAYTESHTISYSPEMGDRLIVAAKKFPKLVDKPQAEVTGETTMNAVRRLLAEGHDRLVYLNFASAKNAGGGFLGGSQAQEESIARATGLYPCLVQCTDYYETNKRSRSSFYTDYMIYAPEVPILKDENGNTLSELLKAAVITAPAVNTGVVKQREPQRLQEVETVMKRRIKKVLAIALEHQHSTIILGAWGCGVFQNDPQQVAKWFREVLTENFASCFKHITFAIYANSERFIQPFQQEFG